MEYFTIIGGLIGGLGLFIYGMYLLSDSLKKLSLGILKSLLEKITSNRIKAMLVGLGITALIQSSSATSVILIGFLNAGLLPLASAIAIMVGSNIGTTVTAQLIAFKLTAVAPFFVFGGTAYFFFAKKQKEKNKGLVILGFGLLFVGLAMMSMAVAPLSQNETARNVFVTFGRYPLLGVLAGLLVTVVFQSSSTVSGMIIAFASAGLLDLASSIYLIFGTNIGTCITAILASIGGNLSAKRLAWGNTIFNTVGTLIAVTMAPLYLYFIPQFSGNIARQVADAHTLFNVINTIIFLPFIPFFVLFLHKIIPGEDYTKKEAKYLDKNLLGVPHLAIGAAINEMIVMLDTCADMLDKARRCTKTFSFKLRDEIAIDEQSVDEMQKYITEYLVEITQGELPHKYSRLIPALLHSVNDLEKVGDYCEDIILLAQRAYENDLDFSDEAYQELEKLFDETENIMQETRKAMQLNDQQAAARTLEIERAVDIMISEYKLNHIKRLENSVCISNAGLVFNDILTNIERLNNHLCNITKGILHLGKR